MTILDNAREALRPVLVVPALLGLSALLSSVATAPASAQEIALAPPGQEAHAPGAPLEVPVAVDPPGPEPGSSSGVLERVVVMLAEPRPDDDDEADLGSLGDVLPAPLSRDLLRLRSRVQSARQVLFGKRGILRLGSLGPDDERSRMRLNLQYNPDPGIRFTIVTG